MSLLDNMFSVKYQWGGAWGTYLVDCNIIDKDNKTYLIEFYDDNINKNTQRWVEEDSLTFPDYSEYII